MLHTAIVRALTAVELVARRHILPRSSLPRSSLPGPVAARPVAPTAILLALVVAAAGPTKPALAQQAGGARTVGPGRIVCNASFCELGSGAHPKQRFRIDVSALPEAEARRLRKCTGVSKPCIVTVEGTQLGNPMKIMADSIQWQD